MPPSHRRRRRINPTVWTNWPHHISFDPHQIQAVKGWHCVDETGNWDVEGLARDLCKALIHSHSGRKPSQPGLRRKWQYAAFEPTRNLFIAVEYDQVDGVILRVWAGSPEKAQAEFDRVREKYLRPPAQLGADEAEFSVISIRMGDPYLRSVRVTPKIHAATDLVLHYGESFLEWHRQFCEQLRERTSGVTILQGSPGTGQLRGLILCSSHRHQRRDYRNLHRRAALAYRCPTCDALWHADVCWRARPDRWPSHHGFTRAFCRAEHGCDKIPARPRLRPFR